MRTQTCFTFILITFLSARLGFTAEAESTSPPISPAKVLRPFEKPLHPKIYTWLQDSGRKDPKHVFTVQEGVVHISGVGRGYITIDQPFKDYHLSAEYKWGKRADGSKYVRNSGILLHGTGPDGGAGKKSWMTSLECQLAQGCEGDLIVIRGKDASGKTIPATVTSETMIGKDGGTRWKKGGKKTEYFGRQFWWFQHDHEFKELLDTRGRWDVASPLGEWTKVECICQGPRVTIKINAVTVNECIRVYPSSGKILFQNEENEIYFRNIEIRPLEK